VIKIQFEADEEMLKDFKRLSELMAISPHDTKELIKRMAKIALKAIDPVLKKTREPRDKGITPAPKLISTKPNRYIPSHIKKAVWIRDNSQCTFINPVTGRRCGSRMGLEIDHKIPIALNGSNDLDNLRLLCFGHNQLMARRIFGKEKMDLYAGTI
jgi:hypothetical protein